MQQQTMGRFRLDSVDNRWTSASASASASAVELSRPAINVQRTHETRYFYSTSLSMVSVWVSVSQRYYSPPALACNKTGFVSSTLTLGRCKLYFCVCCCVAFGMDLGLTLAFYHPAVIVHLFRVYFVQNDTRCMRCGLGSQIPNTSLAQGSTTTSQPVETWDCGLQTVDRCE